MKMEGNNESKHTPKWRWILNESSKTVRLESTESGRDTIMDFVRYGMNWAQPRFNVDGIMIKAQELGEIVEGREHHAEWFKFINHPTAKLIASAPALLEENERLKNEVAILEVYKKVVHSNRIWDEVRQFVLDFLPDTPEHIPTATINTLKDLKAEVDRLTKEKSELVEVLRELTDYLPSVFNPDDLNDLPVLLEKANKVIASSKDRHETLLESERYRDLGLSIQRHFQTLIARNYNNIGKWSNERQDYNFQLIKELEELLKNHNEFLTRIK